MASETKFGYFENSLSKCTQSRKISVACFISCPYFSFHYLAFDSYTHTHTHSHRYDTQSIRNSTYDCDAKTFAPRILNKYWHKFGDSFEFIQHPICSISVRPRTPIASISLFGRTLYLILFAIYSALIHIRSAAGRTLAHICICSHTTNC